MAAARGVEFLYTLKRLAGAINHRVVRKTVVAAIWHAVCTLQGARAVFRFSRTGQRSPDLAPARPHPALHLENLSDAKPHRLVLAGPISAKRDTRRSVIHRRRINVL